MIDIGAGASPAPSGSSGGVVDPKVRVDETGALHLRIPTRAGRWTAAEVVRDRPIGYGRFGDSSPVAGQHAIQSAHGHTIDEERYEGPAFPGPGTNDYGSTSVSTRENSRRGSTRP